MTRRRDRTDRTARLFKVEHVLYQRPQGISVSELASLCGVCVRTTYRDLDALDRELGCIWLQDGKCGLVEGRYLPPIRFSPTEAMRVFLAARLMLRYSNRYDPDTESTFLKLNSVLPETMRQHAQKTLDWMRGLRADKVYVRTMHDLVEAWLSQRTVSIRYHTLGEKTAKERRIDPYFIEPAAAGHSSYVIAYCHRAREIRLFKVERIKYIEPTNAFYRIPSTFDANAYLASAWGIVAGGGVEIIKLRFAPELATIMEEVVWHPSQVTERQKDSSVVMTLSVTNTYELCSWVLSWGDNVEVLEPKELRQEVMGVARRLLQVYETG